VKVALARAVQVSFIGNWPPRIAVTRKARHVAARFQLAVGRNSPEDSSFGGRLILGKPGAGHGPVAMRPGAAISQQKVLGGETIERQLQGSPGRWTAWNAATICRSCSPAR
jgi:hypothetical protein